MLLVVVLVIGSDIDFGVAAAAADAVFWVHFDATSFSFLRV